MPAASRVGDQVSPHGEWSGGQISSGSEDVVIEGVAAATVSSKGTPHIHIPGKKPPHPVDVTSGSSTVVINGKAAAIVGSACGCGGTVVSGAGTVVIGS